MHREKHRDSRILEMIGVLRKNDIAHGITPKKLRRICEDLGPTFVKLGQMMSMRADLLPSAYCDELAKLRTHAMPLPFSVVKQVINEEYGIRDYHTVFESIDETVLGSASIAQVYRAVLKDGKPVVIKIQRPGIKETMGRDVAILRKAISLIKLAPALGDPLDFKVILEEMWLTAQQEMDFLIEESHLEEFARLNSELVYIGVPAVEKHLTTSKILVMEYIEGIYIDNKEKLTEQGYDFRDIAEKLAENYSKQVLDDGFFHADPHPGNIVIRGGKIIWFDLGMMGRLSQHDREMFVSAIKAVIRNDVLELKNIMLSLGVIRGKINHSALYSDIDLMLTKYAKAELSTINLGVFLTELIDLVNHHHIGLPYGFSMLGRGIMTIEGVLAELAPSLNFIEIIALHLSGKEIDIQKELREIGLTAFSSLKKGVKIPSYLSDVLKMTVKGQTKVNLELTGSEEPLRKLDSMMNKLITAVICAGLLVGSSLICTTDMAGKLFGIPALGAVGFIVSLILGLILMIDIFRKRK